MATVYSGLDLGLYAIYEEYMSRRRTVTTKRRKPIVLIVVSK